ncbi:hypothetical protein X942_4836 [Burkholderia pseudomallei MSHR5596]|nr:hypothetical protein DP42_3699 [Burkholderia pseudomallei]KGS76898.1 hypothetical protein X942_4836 [Burkholderia pseudomallei MSHR5596]
MAWPLCAAIAHARVSRSDDPSEPAGWPTSACIHAENGLAVAAIKAEREEWGAANFSFSCARKEHDAALGLYGDQPAHGLSNQGNARCRDAASVRANDAPCSAPRNVCSQARSWRGQARTRSLG